MRFSIADLVITPQNERAFQRVINVTQPSEKPSYLYLEGPADSGKTTLMVARGTEKDLLSKKRALYCHAAEILLALNMEDNVSAEEHLSEMGEVDVLFIDNLEVFLTQKPLGPQACKALIGARKSMGLDTIVSAHMPLSAFSDPDIQQALAGFEVMQCPSLDEEGRMILVSNILLRFSSGAGKNIRMTPDALNYVANCVARDCMEIEPLVERVVTLAPSEGCNTLDTAAVKQLLQV